ncbi:MAG: molybdopterin molybdotransferase MoeA [Thermoprotei archaeon]
MSERIHMIGFHKLLTVNEALEKIKNFIRPIDLESIEVPIENANGMIMATDFIAPFNIPSFNRSAVDGYAVIAEDTYSASPTNPIVLNVKGTIRAGDQPSQFKPIMSGEAYEIYTGGFLPNGANAVVMAEFTHRGGDYINVYKPVAPWENVSRIGEDFAKDDVVVKKGTKLRAWHIGAIASFNVTTVKVFRKLKVSLISTGNEVRKVGSEIKHGEIVESSKPMLKVLLNEDGYEPIDLGIVPDDFEKISEAIKNALKISDSVILTGGTSLGKTDLVPDVISSICKPGIIVHGIAMRPAKPTGIALCGNKPIFMLSGFPVAAIIAYMVFVRPVLKMLLNQPEEPMPKIRARLFRRIAAPVGFRSFMRVKVRKSKEGYIAEPLRLTGSGILSTLTKANGLLVIPENIEGYDEGDEVEIILTQPIYEEE